MDKRIIKSKENIKNAFIELRTKKELRKITVKELCEKANINKSTFYAHYEDIFQLSDQIESDVVKQIIDSITHKHSMFFDVAEFTSELFYAMKSKQELIDIVFSGEQHPNLVYKISIMLKDFIFEINSQLKNNSKFNILLDYIIFGGYYAFEENTKFDNNSDEIINTLIRATTHMNKLFTDGN